MNFRQRSFVALVLIRAALIFCAFAIATPWRIFADEVILQDGKLFAAFDSNSGALTRLEDKTAHWAIEKRPELGVSFQLNALMTSRGPHCVLGQKQRAIQVKKLSDSEVRLQWKDLTSETGEVLPVTMTATVTLTQGALTFDAWIENNSELTVESIDYPYLNDFKEPMPAAPMEATYVSYGTLQSIGIYPDLRNEKDPNGYVRSIPSSQALFCLIQSAKEGLYVEMANPTQPYLLEYTFERQPGPAAHLEFRTRHFIYAHPKSTIKLAPVVLRCYQGDWHAGVDCYKEWRATWFKRPHLPDWIKDVNSWQQLQIDSAEQDYRVPYANLLSYGEECARNGVAAIQLVGWNHGGQDAGDPAQDTEPRLGTWQDLRDAIAQIQAKGVKIILFAKLNWADKTTAWDKEELYKYACTDPSGKKYEQGGYSYYTPTQLAGINNHTRDVMDFNCPAYRNIATKEFKKILALGSEGWLWDEVAGHAGATYNFAADHGYTPPGYVYGGDMPLARQLRAAADQVNPDFLFSGEAPPDWLMQFYPCSYFRINVHCIPVCRYIDSQEPLMVAVAGFDDREMLNLILLNRYIISYEPYNFKGHLADYPLTLDYGKKIDALRRRYKAFLWDAEFRDTLGANVQSDGSNRYSVFVTASGKRAVVVVNQEFDKSITAHVELPSPGRLLVATPEWPDAKPTGDTIKIPARSAAVVMEQ